jgi:hypothetical protein
MAKKSIVLFYTAHIKSIENVPENIQLPFMVKHIYTENSWQPPNSYLFIRLRALVVAKERRKVCSIFWRIRKIAKSNYWLYHVCLSVRPTARMEQLGSHWIDCPNFTLEDFFEIRRENSNFVKKSDTNNGYIT